MSKRHALAVALLMIGAAPVLAHPAPAQPAEKAPEKAQKLSVGDKAPPIAVEKWVKGEPVTGFEKGKVYVVEFWATWCGPCVKGMPHLTEVQKEYKDKGVTIIGVNVWEDQKFDADTYTKVEKFVKASKDMGYTVAYDGAAKAMDTAYMKASGSNGIPTAFIVNQDGKIAYIGHPAKMDDPLKQVVAGTYDIKTAAEQSRKEAAAEKQAGSFNTTYPRLLKSDPAKAYELAKTAMETFGKNDPMVLNQIAWLIVDPAGKVEKKDLDLALKAATRADELTKSKDGAIIDTLARVYFCKGDTAKAIELQKKAVAAAPEAQKEELQAALKEYEAAAKK